MAQAAVGKIDLHKPAIGAKLLHPTCANTPDLSAEKASGIDEMTAVGQHEVTSFVSLGITFRAPGVLTDLWDRLQIVGHRVSIGRIAIPRLKRHDFPNFFRDKSVRESHSWIKAPVVSNLKHHFGFTQAVT